MHGMVCRNFTKCRPEICSTCVMFPFFVALVTLELVDCPLLSDRHHHHVSDTFKSDRTVYATNILGSRRAACSNSRFQWIIGSSGSDGMAFRSRFVH
jgi:hypothetical protein